MIDLALMTTLLTLAIIAAVREYRGVDSVYIGRRWRLIPWRLKLTRHVCVYGPTRSGKTSFVRSLVKELSKSYIVTVLDWHGEYTNIEDVPSIPYSKFRIDINKIPIKLLVEIIGHGLNLNEPSLYMLYKILKNSKIETIQDIVKAVEEYFATTRTEAEMKAAILRRLEYVLSNLSSGVLDVELLAEYSCSVDLSSLTVIEEKRLAASLMLAALYTYYMSQGIVAKGVRHVIVVEEAQNFYTSSTSFSILDHVLMELGKYGVRTILVTNTIPPSHILKHCTLVMFKLRPEQIERELRLSEELERLLLSMRDDEILVIDSSGIVKLVPARDRVQVEHVKPKITYVQEHLADNENEEKLNDETREETCSVKLETVHEIPNMNTVRKVERETEEAKVEDLDYYLARIDEIEKKLALIRERLDEIERLVSYEDELLNKLISAVSSR